MSEDTADEKNMTLTIFYDGTCPLCKAEMNQLKNFDTHQKLKLVDIYQPQFSEQYPQVDVASANRILHAIDGNGNLLLGLDVTQAAWNAVERKPWVNWLRKPGIRVVADWAYLRFAKHRYTISWLLTGKRRSDCEQCRLP
ncbi:thiol-disulfide oxidoreductase DCC family protein [Vibrio nigripulchritudo]|uniref:thiol-disulfide oxidoreductase DCC family protein n=1 Tax=Vibrio nigripulchritudo TaxID=28173 RepID=UPI0003B19278|nr:Putative thiol-disulphide oxidoreductase DCC [Vibrio nigripulchritudo SFn118]